jgi:prephenate dehydrogenase
MKTIAVIIILVLVLFACNSTIEKKQEVKLAPEISETIEKYQQKFEADTIHITAEEHDSATVVYVRLFNPQNMEDNRDIMHSEARQVAAGIYKNLDNVGAFSKIVVDIIYEKDNLCQAFQTHPFSFTYDELSE